MSRKRSARRPVAIVTGAGSGVGRACALLLVQQGWRVSLVGRRATALAQTVALAGQGRKNFDRQPADIADPAAVSAVVAAVVARWGRIDALINAAGTNTPRRSLRDLSDEDYHRLIAANLHGAFYLTRACLPALRKSSNGTIVNINSEAGLRANAKAGPAYVAGKFALAGLTESINAEEGPAGVRACSIFPGDIDTPLLDLRPVPPSASQRKRMLQPEDVAGCIAFVLQLPARAVVEQLVIRPRNHTNRT